MKMLTSSAVLVAAMLALPACGGGHAVTITDAASGSVLHTKLPASLVKLIHSFRTDSSVTANRVEVYGPSSRRELVRASSGDLVQKLAAERKGFYVLVLHGHFVAGSHPQGTKAPRGTVETQVWSAAEGVTDTGISNRLPAAVYRLNGPTLVRVSAPSPMQRGFTSIPNLKKISESRSFSICSFKGTSVPAYCRPGGSLHSTRGFEQVWEPKLAPPKSGEPSQVVVDVFRAPSAPVAKHYSVVYAHTAGYTALPGAAINNGIAARINSLANDGRTEFRFAWTSGRSMVEVNIIGAGLTVRDAQAVARRARPARPDSPARVVEPGGISYRPVGVSLAAAPANFSPRLPRNTVLGLYEGRFGLVSKRPVMALRLVRFRGRRFLGWVLIWHHTSPISYGPFPVRSTPVCDSVAIFALQTGSWATRFQACPGG